MIDPYLSLNPEDSSSSIGVSTNLNEAIRNPPHNIYKYRIAFNTAAIPAATTDTLC